MNMEGKVVLQAPAKLNLELRVTGRRVDGYHELDSPTVPIGWLDTVTASLRNDGRIVSRIVNEGRASARIAAADELAAKAAGALAKAAGVSSGVSLTINKRIPVGAGLGGGSSDAAAALLACAALWRIGWPQARLQELAATIGADVPFFIRCRQARMRGIGERLERLATPVGGHALVCVPAERASTAAVFAQMRARGGDSQAQSVKSTSCNNRNDLEQFAILECPAAGRLLQSMRSCLGDVRLSGSGSACFALFPTRVAAGEAVARLAAKRLAADFAIAKVLRMRPRSLGSGQVVRQRILAPSCVGSNPTSPALSQLTAP